MKKLLTLGLAILLTITLTGCDFLNQEIDFGIDKSEDKTTQDYIEDIDTNKLLSDLYNKYSTFKNIQYRITHRATDGISTYLYKANFDDNRLGVVEYSYTPKDIITENGTVMDAFYIFEDTQLVSYENINSDFTSSYFGYTESITPNNELVPSPIVSIKNNTYLSFLQNATISEILYADVSYAEIAISVDQAYLTETGLINLITPDTNDNDVTLIMYIDMIELEILNMDFYLNATLSKADSSDATVSMDIYGSHIIKVEFPSNIPYLSPKSETEITTLKEIIKDGNTTIANSIGVSIYEQIRKPSGSFTDTVSTNYAYFASEDILAYHVSTSLDFPDYFYAVDSETTYQYIVMEDYYVRKSIQEEPVIEPLENLLITYDFDRYFTQDKGERVEIIIKQDYESFKALNPDFMDHIDTLLNEKADETNNDLSSIILTINISLNFANRIEAVSIDFEEYVETKYDVDYISVSYSVYYMGDIVTIDTDYLNKTVIDENQDFIDTTNTYETLPLNTILNKENETPFDLDIFSFVVTEAGTYEFSITSDSDFLISVTNSSLERVHEYNRKPYIEVTLEPGTYYITSVGPIEPGTYSIEATKK